MRRFDRLAYIHTLDPVKDCDEIFNLITRYEFPLDYRMGFKMAGMNDVAMPSVARVLHSSGQFASAGQKRVEDTSLFEYEAKRSGLDSDHGRRTIRALNRIHGHYSITNQDYLFILASWTVEPIRWIQKYGWRKLAEREVQAMVESNRKMGHLMGVKGIPADYRGFADLLDRELRERGRFEEVNNQMAHQLLDIVISWVPRPLAPTIQPVFATLTDDHVLTLLGLAPASPVLRRCIHGVLRTRARIIRLLPPRPDHRPYTPRPKSYQQGWTIDQLGPATLRAPSGSQTLGRHQSRSAQP